MQANLTEWNFLVSSASDVDEMWNNFHNSLKHLFESCVPSRFVPIRASDKDWMTPLTKMLILGKWLAFREHDWLRYNHLKLKVRIEVEKAKQIWADKLMSSTEGLWKLVKAQQVNYHSDLSSIGPEDNVLHTLTSDLAEHFLVRLLLSWLTMCA